MSETMRALESQDSTVIDEFHKLWHEKFHETRWLGVKAQKCPFDLFVYQEIVFERRPDVIIECGTAAGGTALFLATVCELIGCGRVLTIDRAGCSIEPHRRISFLQGDVLSRETLARVANFVARESQLMGGAARVMVILDDDHGRDHVLAEMRDYARFVTPGDYLIVEDTDVNGRPVRPEHGPGPAEAIDQFLKEGALFDVDASREKFLLTFNRGGYLRRKS